MNLQKATFAGGCYWCTEAVFLEIKGVTQVVSGFIGGFIKNPAYREVCNDVTGHAEAVEITFDAETISYETLLEIFFATHDPTTLNRQGADVGSQYRSAVFYHDEAQKLTAEKFISFLNDENVFNAAVVTKLEEATVFYKAEEYHQNYYNQNAAQGYCQFVIAPKVAKLRKNFQEFLK